MPETTTPVVPTDQTGSLDAGHTTTEYQQTKIVVILTSVLAVLGTITTVLDKALTIFPESNKGLGLWLAIGSLAVGALASIAYTVQRTAIKVAALRAGATVPTDPAIPARNPDDAAANLGK
jgi:hypothetical protein